MFPLSLDLALIAFGRILNCEFFEKWPITICVSFDGVYGSALLWCDDKMNWYWNSQTTQSFSVCRARLNRKWWLISPKIDSKNEVCAIALKKPCIYSGLFRLCAASHQCKWIKLLLRVSFSRLKLVYTHRHIHL